MTTANPYILTLASNSSRRLDLLYQVNITPDFIKSPNIDESPLKSERGSDLALRLSLGKANAILEQNKLEKTKSYILAADTVVACGAQILDKPADADEARAHITKLSGRRHHVHGGITLITPENQVYQRKCKTLIQFKPLSSQEIEDYIHLGEWEGKAGAYAIQGYAAAFVKQLNGSYSNVVGLSLYDTLKLLKRGGFKIPTSSKNPQ